MASPQTRRRKSMEKQKKKKTRRSGNVIFNFSPALKQKSIYWKQLGERGVETRLEKHRRKEDV